MPDYLYVSDIRNIFAEKKMERKNFRSITDRIKKECLSFGYGKITFDKDEENLWIDDYENSLSVSIHVDAIKIDFDTITLCEDNQCVLTFDHVSSIDRQIQIYESIYRHQDQLRYYELDWDNYFKALRVHEEDSYYYWRVLTPEEARHIWYNGHGDIFQLYDDGTEGVIEDDIRLNDCIRNGYPIGISLKFLAKPG